MRTSFLGVRHWPEGAATPHPPFYSACLCAASWDSNALSEVFYYSCTFSSLSLDSDKCQFLYQPLSDPSINLLISNLNITSLWASLCTHVGDISLLSVSTRATCSSAVILNIALKIPMFKIVFLDCVCVYTHMCTCICLYVLCVCICVFICVLYVCVHVCVHVSLSLLCGVCMKQGTCSTGVCSNLQNLTFCTQLKKKRNIVY